jgi:Relaxase/Mobilisation nuclease domain
VIIKGKSRSGPLSLAVHLGNAETNEKISLIETRDTIADDLRGALIELDAYKAGTQCEKALYHAQINPEPPHRLTPEQRTEAIDALEARLGLTGHARVVVVHEKKDREHIHVVWSRINLDTNRSVSDSHNYRKHEEVARDLERRFGHERVQGAHHEREGPDGEKARRPDRTASRAELRQEERTGISGKMVKEHVTRLFRASDGAESFKAALEDGGYVLAQGDWRDFIIVDRAGGIHSLARRIDGVNAAELREFMKPVRREDLPTSEQAKEIAAERARQARELDESRAEAKREKAYARGDDYVSQSQAAQKDHSARQEELDRRFGEEQARKREEELQRQQAEESAKRQEAERANSHGTRSKFADTASEMTDAKQERLNRLLDAIADEDHEREHPDPDRQREAPGGGRTRSR